MLGPFFVLSASDWLRSATTFGAARLLRRAGAASGRRPLTAPGVGARVDQERGDAVPIVLGGHVQRGPLPRIGGPHEIRRRGRATARPAPHRPAESLRTNSSLAPDSSFSYSRGAHPTLLPSLTLRILVRTFGVPGQRSVLRVLRRPAPSPPRPARPALPALPLHPRRRTRTIFDHHVADDGDRAAGRRVRRGAVGPIDRQLLAEDADRVFGLGNRDA